MKLTNSKAMRDADERAIHVLGIPSTLLMTNAARELAAAALELMGKNKSAVIFCGSGNNGGDGIGAAVYLLRRGAEIRCFLAGERAKMTEDSAEMERRLLELGGSLEDFNPEDAQIRRLTNEAGAVIDALFGIGLNSELRGKALAAVKIINESKAPVVSADIASGVEADTGRILGEAVRANITVAFSMPKIGHLVEPGCTCCGELRVADIGIPAEILRVAETDIFALGAGARVKITQRTSLTGEYYYLLPGQTADDYQNCLSLGVDLETGGHVFQLRISNAQPMFERGFITETSGKWSKGDIYFGFTINRVFTIVKPKE